MEKKLSEKLEWQLLLKYLADYCQTQEAKLRARQLEANKKREQVLERWSAVEPLLSLVRVEQLPVIGDFEPIQDLLKALLKGQTLEAEHFKGILNVVLTVQRVEEFAREYSPNNSTLRQFRSELVPLPHLAKSILKAIDENGVIRDDASPELAHFRTQKRSLRKRVEETIANLSQNSEFSKYLQDDFFSIREDRYVIPIKIDGRGRVEGNIIDTSSSGQTLFIEPLSIQNQNQTLKELELSERLEIFRILKELSQQVAKEVPHLKKNYEQIVRLDLMFAEARLAYALDARPVQLSQQPLIKLHDAVHPLLKLSSLPAVIPNTIELQEHQNALIISGPNAGGKTVVLKTVGIIHMMVAAGLMPPVSEASEIFLFDKMYIEMGDTQDLSSHLSTFSGHLTGLKPILENAGRFDIVFLDEICMGTEPQTGAALAQAMLENFVSKGVWVIATTHYDNLKMLAMNTSKMRSAAMGYDSHHRPTYKLNVDIPGLSFGIEVAEHVGIPMAIVRRARELHGKEASAFEEAIQKLISQASEYEHKMQEADVKIRKAEEEKRRWADEVQLLKTKRHELAEAVVTQYEQELKTLRDKFDQTLKDLKTTDPQNPVRKELTGTLQEFKEQLQSLENAHIQKGEEPGEPVRWERLRIGDSVYVTRFRKMAKVLKLGRTESDKIEVEVGMLKFQVLVKELRIVSHGQAKKSHHHLQTSFAKEKAPEKTSRQERMILIPSGTNTLNVRGFTADEALEKMWKFLDAAVMRGEHAVIIVHGHGTQTLKQTLRRALESECPYDIEFFAGTHGEGGDGVTIVYFQTKA